MTTHRFSTGKQFYWNKEFYEVRRLLPENRLNIANLHTGEMCSVEFLPLFRALVNDELQFIVDGKPARNPQPDDYLDLSDYPDYLQSVAEYRLEVIKPLLNLLPHKRKEAVKKRVEKYKEMHRGQERSLLTTISLASVYRWIKDYTQSGSDIRALIPNTRKRGGTSKSRFKDEVEVIIQATINDLCGGSLKRTIDYIHHEIVLRIKEENQFRPAREQLEPPGRGTVVNRLNVLDEKGEVHMKRKKLVQYGQTEYPDTPLARVEIDHTHSNIIVVDEEDMLPLGRLTFTYCLDTAFRYPLGYYLGFEPPSYLTVMECLYHAILPKENVQERYGVKHDWLAYGIPFELYVDNGKEFIGRDLDDACASLGISLHRLPVKTPHFKAAIERMFGTINTGFLHGVRGTTFSDPVKRGDYDSLEQACIGLRELDRMMTIFLVDIYAESFHRGLKGIPARRWGEALAKGFFPRVPNSAKELKITLGRVMYRSIQPGGIDFHSLRYNSDKLGPLRGRMLKRKRRGENHYVKVKYNPSNISYLYVLDPDEEKYLAVPALAQNYTQGLSLWKHKVIHNYVLSKQDKVDIEALAEARRELQKIVEAGMKRKKKRTRVKAARWQYGGSQTDGSGVVQEAAENETLLTSAPDIDLDDLQDEGWDVSHNLLDTWEVYDEY